MLKVSYRGIQMSRERSEIDGSLPPLFETKQAKGRLVYRLFAATVMVAICFIWVYRANNIPKEGEAGRWAWIGLFLAEIWFTFYWIITQSVRWNIIHRYPFKDRLAERHGDVLPRVDIFVCTADPTIEPPILVINTVLSVMAYDYPPEKLSIYLSDDGGSDLTFYALLEASRFSKHWIPFCKTFDVEPRSPAAYFAQSSGLPDESNHAEWIAVKERYEDMKYQIETAVEMGSISDEIREQHKGFSEWNSNVTKRDHQTILQILIDGRDRSGVENEGHALPSLVYLAREKRPQHPHNFKAGAMNALTRVSSKISNGPVILNVDCDMYSNSSGSIRDALCFLMDEENGHEFAFVQFPQSYNNLTKNDIYANGLKGTWKFELPGLDGLGGPLYSGTGCFHRRQSLCGMKYSKDYKEKWNQENEGKALSSVSELEERSKILANCESEKNTLWGKEMGLKYGCPVEDVLTGLSIKRRGWKSVFYYPERKGFFGVAPITMDMALVQYKRWSEGLFQIFLSYCPFMYGFGKIKFGLQMGYCVYLLWAPNSLPTIYYLVAPTLCFINGIPLFPEMSSFWILPFAYVLVTKSLYNLLEELRSGTTLIGWWNLQRMWVFRSFTSFLFGTVDTIIKQLGLTQTTFTVTPKVVDDDVLKRYENQTLEFGSSRMFTIIATLALFHLFSLAGGIKQVITRMDLRLIDLFVLNFLLCGLMVMINIPVYEAMFIRKDKGCIPTSTTLISIVLASVLCTLSLN